MIVEGLVFSACLVVVFGCWTLALWLLLRAWERRIRAELGDRLREFIEAPNDKTPSPLAVLIDQVATLLAARMAQQLKAMLAGTESGLSKGEASALEGAAVAALPPWAAMLASILPKRIKRQLLSNPQMVASLGKLAQGANHGTDRPSQGAFEFTDREE